MVSAKHTVMMKQKILACGHLQGLIPQYPVAQLSGFKPTPPHFCGHPLWMAR